MSYEGKNLETIALHAGWRNDETTGSVAVPIHQTTSYQFNDTAHAASLFGLQEFGNIYTRIMNPTCDVLEQRMAALDGGVAGLAVASGQTASAYSIQNLARSGDNIVSSSHLYGGTYNQFKNNMREMGIEVRFVDPTDPENFAKATDEKTRAYFAETLPNPKLHVFPISEVAEIGRKHNIPLIVDNTAAPVLCRPFDHGAAITTYSTTKYIGGHGTTIGGLIVDGGNFDWGKAGADRQPAMNTPDPWFEVLLKEPDDFLKIRETLSRIGVASRKERKLYQSCHILHKQGRYYIVHFKELFALDGKDTNLSENDIARRNTIVKLLSDWGLVEMKATPEPIAPLSQIKIISFKEKDEWVLETKYNIGKKREVE